MRRILLSAAVPALLLSGWGQAAAQNAVAAAGAAARSVSVAPVPMSAVHVPLSLTPTAMGTALLSPTLTPSLPESGVSLTPTLTQKTGALAPVTRPAARTRALGTTRALPAPPGRTAAKSRALTPKTKSPVLAAVKRSAKSLGALGNMRRLESSAVRVGRVFDGLGRLPGFKAAVPSMEYRPPDWSEDRRINRAIERLNDSDIGRDIYAYVYENHDDLRILVDDDRKADYDARLSFRHGKPVLHLTEKLVDNESLEVIAAYMTREMTHLYLESFPESAERNYMAHGNMARVFADLTGSDIRSRGRVWAHGKDQWIGEGYAMKRYYGSWKEAVTQHVYAGRRIQDTAFFNWLRESGRDDYGRSLHDLYWRGKLSWSDYRQMRDYFDGFIDSENEWLSDTDRW